MSPTHMPELSFPPCAGIGSEAVISMAGSAPRQSRADKLSWTSLPPSSKHTGMLGTNYPAFQHAHSFQLPSATILSEHQQDGVSEVILIGGLRPTSRFRYSDQAKMSYTALRTLSSTLESLQSTATLLCDESPSSSLRSN